MSFMHFEALPSNSLSVGVADLDPVVVTNTGPGSRAGFRVGADGNLYKYNGSFTQVNVLTNWLRPDFLASNQYYVRTTRYYTDGKQTWWMSDSVYESGDPNPETYWHDLGADRDFILQLDPDPYATGTYTSDIYIEVRWQDGSNAAINRVTSIVDGTMTMAEASFDIDFTF